MQKISTHLTEIYNRNRYTHIIYRVQFKFLINRRAKYALWNQRKAITTTNMKVKINSPCQCWHMFYTPFYGFWLSLLGQLAELECNIWFSCLILWKICELRQEGAYSLQDPSLLYNDNQGKVVDHHSEWYTSRLLSANRWVSSQLWCYKLSNCKKFKGLTWHLLLRGQYSAQFLKHARGYTELIT